MTGTIPLHRWVLMVIVGLAMLAVIAAAGCSRGAPSANSSGSGNSGSGEHRLVVLSPAVAVMLRDLGLADSVVGKHDYDLVLPDTVPAVGHQEALDYEAILGVRPTKIIIEWGSRPLPPRLTELAERHGWAVRRVTLLTIDDIARTIDDLAIDFGVASFETGDPDRPEGVPGDLEDIGQSLRFRDPSARFADQLPSATLARAWSVRGEGFAGVGPVLLLGSTTPPGALGPGSFHDQILRRIGGVPAIETGSPWLELDAEDIRRLDPSAIVLVAPRDPGSESGRGSAEDDSVRLVLERLGRVGTLDIKAVRSGRVALIDDPLALLPSTSMADFADDLAAILEGWRGAQEP